MQELLYTSVPRGLKPGSRGFCTVLSTQGMVAPLAAALEGLSGYRPVFPIGHERVAENPVVYSHLKLQVAGKSWYVLSRIADYGLDYSQRTNKLAHHLVLDKSELPAAGPASLLRVSGIMRESWEGDPKIVPPKPISRQPSAPSGVCQAWREMTGDAGWAGVLAESFLKDPNRPVILLFEPGQDLRHLIDESLSLLPAERRWDVTFSTYFTGSSQGITCLWRGIVVGSKEATESLRFVNALRIDLTSADIGRAEGGELVEAARRGIRPSARPTPPPKQAAPSEQQQSRVVATDDAVEPTVYRSHFDEAVQEPPTVPVGSHGHSGAPPRLTRSAFRFARADQQMVADEPEARTTRVRRIIVALVIFLLLGGSAVVIVALNRHPPNSEAQMIAEQEKAPAGSSKKENATKREDSTKSHSSTSVGNHRESNKIALATPAQRDGPAHAASEKEPDEKRPDEKRPDEKRPDEKKPDEKKPDEKKPDEKRSSEVVVVTLPPAESKEPRVIASVGNASDSDNLLMQWLKPVGKQFESLEIVPSEGRLQFKLPEQDGSKVTIATIRIERPDDGSELRILFSWEDKSPKQLREKFLQRAKFCLLLIAAGNGPASTHRFRFSGRETIRNAKLHDGKFVFECKNLADLVKVSNNGQTLRCDGLTFFHESLKEVRLELAQNKKTMLGGTLAQFHTELDAASSDVFIQTSKDASYELRVNVVPHGYTKERAKLATEFSQAIKNKGQSFLDDLVRQGAFSHSEVAGAFAQAEREFKNVRMPKPEQTDLMKLLKEKSEEIASWKKKADTAERMAEECTSAKIVGGTIECLVVTGGQNDWLELGSFK